MLPDFICWNANSGIRMRLKGLKIHLGALLSANPKAVGPEILINNWVRVREYKGD